MGSYAARRRRFSPAIEDYVKTMYQLEQEHAHVSTCLLAQRLGLTPGSVTGMLHKLAKLDLIRYTPYHGAILTQPGQQVALEMVRHHRLLELYLVDVLGYTWDDVDAEADVLEHAISEQLEARMAERLGHPAFDPHGDPIPRADLTLPPGAFQPLALLPVNHTATVTRVLDQDAAHLRYFETCGLVPGAAVMVHERTPFDGPLMVAVGDTIQALDQRLAHTILVLTNLFEDMSSS